jgi:hypothetical protein
MVDYLLLTLSNWAPDGGWFDLISGWHLLVAGGLMLVVAVLATR